MSYKAIDQLTLSTLAVEQSFDGIIIGDPAGNITYINAALLQIYGGSDKAELIGKHVLDLIAPQHKQRAFEKSMHSIKTGEAWRETFAVINKQGKTMLVDISVTPVKNENGTLIGFIDIVREKQNQTPQ